jgi:hypothetical protein
MKINLVDETTEKGVPTKAQILKILKKNYLKFISNSLSP